MNEYNIVLVDYGLAYLIGNTIYINKDLPNHPDIYSKVLEHELKHLKGNRNIDWTEKFDKNLFYFIINHPKTWLQFLPIWFASGRITYDKNLILFYAFIIAWILFCYGVIKWMI